MAAPAQQVAGTTQPAGNDAGGLPQFDPQWWPGQIVWLLIIFAVLFVLMKWLFVPRVGGTIAARDGRIADDIAQARRLKDEAEAQAAAAAQESEVAHAQARKLAADAKARAQAEAAARQAEEDDKLARVMETAEAGIRNAREEALAHVREIASDTAQAIVEKLSGRPATATEVDQAFAGRA
jgi:F-type H+-transporting ATPase subunit b